MYAWLGRLAIIPKNVRIPIPIMVDGIDSYFQSGVVCELDFCLGITIYKVKSTFFSKGPAGALMKGK